MTFEEQAEAVIDIIKLCRHVLLGSVMGVFILIGYLFFVYFGLWIGILGSIMLFCVFIGIWYLTVLIIALIIFVNFFPELLKLLDE